MTEQRADGLSIRACRLEDIAVVLELWRQADATPGVTDNPDDLRRAVAESPAHVLVAEVGGRVIGSILGAFAVARPITAIAARWPVQRSGAISRSRTLGIAPATSDATAKACAAVRASALPSGRATTSTNEMTTVPRISAPAMSARRPPAALTIAGARSAPGASDSATSPAPVAGSSCCVATKARGTVTAYGAMTSTRFRSRRSPSAARNGVRAPCAAR